MSLIETAAAHRWHSVKLDIADVDTLQLGGRHCRIAKWQIRDDGLIEVTEEITCEGITGVHLFSPADVRAASCAWSETEPHGDDDSGNFL